MDVNSINISRGADTVVLDNTVLSGSLDVGLNTDNDGADSVTVRNGAMIGGIVDLGFDDDTFTASTNAMIDGNVSTGALSPLMVVGLAIRQEHSASVQAMAMML